VQTARHRLRGGSPACANKIVHTSLNPRRRPLGCCSREQLFPVRHPTGRRACNRGQWPVVRGQIDFLTIDDWQPTADAATRPETHQNLIHRDKEPRSHHRRPRQRHDTKARDALPRLLATPNSIIPRYCSAPDYSAPDYSAPDWQGPKPSGCPTADP
jgi:hypothetical protein